MPPGRLFPELERGTRENIDFGSSLQPDGAIHFRGEFNDFPAVDAQAGTIRCGVARAPDVGGRGVFLNRTWLRIKRATQWLIAKDANGDGLIEGNQHNTLDADWFGPVAWLSGLYLAALAGAAEMADETGDAEFARQCRGILEPGRKKFVAQLFDGEYFINKVDPQHLDAINSGDRLRNRPGLRAKLGVSGSVCCAPVAEERDSVGIEIDLAVQFFAGCRPVSPGLQAGPVVRDGGGGGIADVHISAAQLGLRAGAGTKGLNFAAPDTSNECMNGFGVPGCGAHDLGGDDAGKAWRMAAGVLHDRYHASRRNPWNAGGMRVTITRARWRATGCSSRRAAMKHHGPKGLPGVRSQDQTGGLSGRVYDR